MTRITSSASNRILIGRFLQTQKTLLDLETQIGTEKRSQTYSGLALSSQRLLNIENAKASLERFNSNNEQAQLRLDIQSTAVSGIRDAIRDFRELLLEFSNGDQTDPERVEQIQSHAFAALKNIQNLLNTEADGRYIFGGGTIRTEPVSFGLSTVSAFQSIYDGARVTYPTTREAHLENFSISRSSVNLDPAHLSFEQTAGTSKSRISTTAASGQFQNIAAGTAITISGTVGGVNDGVYTVDSVDTNGLWIDVRTEQLTNEGTTAAPILAEFSYPNPDDPRQMTSINAEVTFDRRTNTIRAIDTNALNSIPVGSIVTISGTTNNNGTFTVDSNDGTDLVIESQRFVSDGGANSTLETLGGGNPLTFSIGTGADGEDQIITNTGTFGTLEAGQRIKVNSTNTENDGKTFTVQSVIDNGTNVTITLASDESLDATIPTVTAGVVSLNARPFSFNAAERNFYFNADAVAASADTISFTDGGASQDTITLNGSTFTDAKGNLLPAGTRITVTNAGANNGTYTIESISTNGLTATLVATDTLTTAAGVTDAVLAGSGSITYTDNNPAADSITLGGGYFRDLDGNNLPAGTRITFAGTTGGLNDKTFTIASVSTNGRTATLIPTDAVDDTTPTQTAGTISVGGTVGTISATSYYKGDTSTQTHRVSDSRSFNFDITGIDPAFEKAIRGMFLVLQGEYGTEGGLDRNQNRVSEGLYLMDDALDRTNNQPPPFGTELNSNIEEMEIILGYRAVLLNDVKKTNQTIIAAFDNSIASIENIDPLESITRLLDTQRTLEASYQTFARVRQLSLTKFL